MRHPLELVVSRDYRRQTLVALLVVSAAFLIARWYLGRDLVSTNAPNGLLSLELAGEPIIVQAQVNDWTLGSATTVGSGLEARSAIAMLLGLDYAFLLTCSTALAITCLWAGGMIGGSAWTRVALGLAWALWVAAALGAVENVLLLRLLVAAAGPAGSTLPSAAPTVPDLSSAGTIRLMALVKYAVFELALLYLVATGLAGNLRSLLQRRRTARVAS